MGKCIGVLTAGGDSPGLNAAIRAIGKSALNAYNMQVIGFRDGFRGLMENRTIHLEGEILSGILTLGGTILGTSRDKPHKMPVGSKVQDMTEVMIDNYHRHNLEAIVCIGGGGTQKNAYRLAQAGVNVITLPKTIDNDVAMTDITFGFDTALSIATDAIDRLHSTAHSHHRIIVVEIMGHNSGWLGLGAGVAGGADVILIPEIPYDVRQVADAIKRRRHRGKNFSIVAVSEGALSHGGRQGTVSAARRRNRQPRTRKSRRRPRPPLRPSRSIKPQHAALVGPAGISDRPGKPGDHSRSPAARWHANGRRSYSRDPAGHRLRRRHRRSALQLHGGGQGGVNGTGGSWRRWLVSARSFPWIIPGSGRPLKPAPVWGTISCRRTPAPCLCYCGSSLLRTISPSTR